MINLSLISVHPPPTCIYLVYYHINIRSLWWSVVVCGSVLLTERCQTWSQTKFHLCSLCSHSSIIPSKLHLSDCPVFHPTTRKIDNNIAQRTSLQLQRLLFLTYFNPFKSEVAIY